MASEKIDALELDITSKTSAENVDKLIDSLSKLSSELGKIKPKRVTVDIKQTGEASEETSKNADKLTRSFFNQAIRISALISVYRKLSSKIADGIANSMTYIKTLNMFTVSLGEYADDATKYGETVRDALGIDIAGWQNAQGIFQTLITGFGVTGDKAAYMSQNLTQLSYDIASFYNLTNEEAQNKLKAAISGRLEPIRKLGYDLSQAKLVDIAKNPANYGKQTFTINEQTGAIEENTVAVDENTRHKIVNFNQLTQQEKVQLRYIALMTQVTQVQGNYARALKDPANQMRIFNEQTAMTSRALGNMFIPALNQVLPYLTAFSQLAQEAFQSIASLFGFEIPDMKDRTDISKNVSPYNDVVKATGKAKDNAKKMKDYLLGIDELNVLNPNTGAGAGGGAGKGQNSNLNNLRLPGYDFLGKAIENSIAQAKENIKKFFADLKANPFLLDDIFKWGAGELGSNFWEGLLGKSPAQLAVDAQNYGLTLGEAFCVAFASKAGEVGSDIWTLILGKSPEKLGEESAQTGDTIAERLLYGITEKLNNLGFNSSDSAQMLISDLFGTPAELGARAEEAGRTVGEQFGLELYRSLLKFLSYNPISAWFYKLSTGNDLNADIQKLEERLGISGKDIGKSFGNAFAAGVSASTGKVKTAGEKLGKAGASGANSEKKAFKTAGENTGEGYILGINSERNILKYKKSGDVVAKTTLKALKDFLLIKSPSRRAMGYGELTGEGYAIGVENSIKLATKAATDLASSAMRVLGNASGISNSVIMNGTIADPMSSAKVSIPSTTNMGYGISAANEGAMATLASNIYQSVVSGMSVVADSIEGKDTKVIIDGKEVFKAVQTESRKRGVPISDGAFSR